jgi:hypothetical protein
MTKRLRQLLKTAIAQKLELDSRVSKGGGFAYSLASQSMSGHIDDLSQQIAAQGDRSEVELIEFCLKAPQFNDGSVPLRVLSKATEEFRQLVGYAVLRLTRGGIGKKRVPEQVYNDLDLRLAAVLPGSSRLVITATADRDLLNDGLSKSAFERLFRVLESEGHGQEFLESVSDLGPHSSKRLREIVELLRKESAELQLSWRYAGLPVRSWVGTKEILEKVSFALAVTEVKAQSEVTLQGVVELLSKRERIHLLTNSGETVRILFPLRLLTKVASLHLDQGVSLRCSVTETNNPFTGETSTFHELLDVIS